MLFIVEKIIVGRDKSDMQAFGEKGTAFIGKHIVGEGEDAHLTNPVYMDVLRPHVIMVTGKRGTGKCMEENTLIPLDDGSVVPIKELEFREGSIIGLDGNLKSSVLERSAFFKRKVDTLLRIKTRSGREIRLTPEHPLLTIKGWKDAKELTVGSRIATPRKIAVEGKVPMKEHEIKLLAYLIAEGHICNSLVWFSNSDARIVSDFTDAVESFDSTLKVTPMKEGCFRVNRKNPEWKVRESAVKKLDGSPRRVCYNDKTSIVKWLSSLEIYGRKSNAKFIPQCIQKLPNEQLAIFLNRLFSCDGSVYKNKTTHGAVWQISYSSSSEQLIRRVQNILLRFGIISKLRDKKTKCNGKIFNTFELIIGTENATSFIEQIGFFGRKHDVAQACITESAGIKRNTNVDTIPKEIWDIYRPKNWAEIGRSMNYAIPKSLVESVHYSPSRQKLLQIALMDNNDTIKAIAESDIFWDEIMLIEKLEGDFTVCDIEVPSLHNFVANDIIVHNSYTAFVIAEDIFKQPDEIRNNLAVLFVDTMGIYWSSRSPNEKDRELLKEWDMKPEGIDIRLFVPAGFVKEYEDVGVRVDAPFTISWGELTAQDWMLTFGFNPLETLGMATEHVIKRLKLRLGDRYSIDDIISEIENDERIDAQTRNALVTRFSAAGDWGIFEEQGTPVREFFKRGQITVLDISHFARSSGGWSVRSMAVGLLARKIFQDRLQARKAEEFQVMGGSSRETIPMVWIMIDESHQFLPAEGETAASDPLLSLIKEGREPGISTLLITQMPGKLNQEALAQSDILISHRLTSEADIRALRSIMQTYMVEDIQRYINNLPRQVGTAIIMDDSSERIFPIQVRPRLSWHAGGSPSAIKKKGLLDI